MADTIVVQRFSTADFVVFGVMVTISIAIGLYHAFSGGKQKTTSEYLMGNRRMKVIPTAVSLLVTFESSIMMLGFPAEMYVYGVMYWLNIIGFFLSGIVSTVIFVPMLHQLNLTSAYEYLEVRFKSKLVRKLGTFLGMASYIWYMGIVLYGPGIALEAVTGFPLWISTVIIAGASIFYTCLGGINAVIWTDVFQSMIMFGGMFATIIQGSIVVGGPARVYEVCLENERLNLFVFSLDPTVRHTFWNLLLGSFIRGLGFSFNQSTIQRICGTETVREGRKVMLISTIGYFITLSLAAMQGLLAFTYFYNQGCDPLESGAITDPNQVIPYLVMDIFKSAPGMPGLFLAAVFSACLSTLSSGLSSLSALTWEEGVKPWAKDLSEFKATLVAKASVFVYGVSAIGIAYLVATIGGTLTQITGSLLGAFAGPLTGLFLLGAFCPSANWKGAVVGCVSAYTITCWMAMGSNFSPNKIQTPWLPPGPTDMCQVRNMSYSQEWLNGSLSFTSTTPMESTVKAIDPQGLDKLYAVSYMWIPTIGIMITLVVGMIVSLITGLSKPSEVDPRLIVPIFDYCVCLPKKIRRKLWCGIDHDKKVKMPVDGTDEQLLSINADDAVLTNNEKSIPQADHQISESGV